MIAKSRTTTAIASALLALGVGAIASLGLMCGLPAQVMAQSISETFSTFTGDTSAPIDIESNSLEIHEAKKVAIFDGDVIAIQDGWTLQTSRLEVHYKDGEKSKPGADAKVTAAKADEKASKAGGGGTQITLLKARGTVLISTQDGQSSSSKWARVDMREQKITIGGDVVLTQGENILKGDQLVIDLVTGKSRLVNPGDGPDRPGRVRALFIPGTTSKKAKAAETPDKKAPSERTSAGGWSTEVR